MYMRSGNLEQKKKLAKRLAKISEERNKTAILTAEIAENAENEVRKGKKGKTKAAPEYHHRQMTLTKLGRNL